MSIKAWGVFRIIANEPVSSQIKVAFQVTIIAARNGIGIKLGGNVWREIMKEYENIPDIVVFELVDDPLDIDAESLFIGDRVKVFVNEYREDTGESLKSRMARVQIFLEEVLKIQLVCGIVLHINIITLENPTTIEMKASEFLTTVLDKYQENNNWTPSLRLIINKEGGEYTSENSID